MNNEKLIETQLNKIIMCVRGMAYRREVINEIINLEIELFRRHGFNYITARDMANSRRWDFFLGE